MLTLQEQIHNLETILKTQALSTQIKQKKRTPKIKARVSSWARGEKREEEKHAINDAK